MHTNEQHYDSHNGHKRYLYFFSEKLHVLSVIATELLDSAVNVDALTILEGYNKSLRKLAEDILA